MPKITHNCLGFKATLKGLVLSLLRMVQDIRLKEYQVRDKIGLLRHFLLAFCAFIRGEPCVINSVQLLSNGDRHSC